MSDGSIKIAIKVDGKDVDHASDGLKGLGKDAEQAGKSAGKTTIGIKEIVTSLGLVKIGAAAFRILASSMDAAISRFDTFQTFPKVMDALGVSAEASSDGIDKLSAGIDGLPTKLDDIVSTTQRMYTSFNDLDKATDTALGLNNALLASGASATDAQRGTDQYIQALQKGKFELEEWKTLQETMTIGLFQIAESFGMTERELKAALDSGEISMDSFNDRMIELGTGTGTLADLAKANSQGIATSLTNLKNTASRGLADIITAFNDLSLEVSGSSIAEHMDTLKVVINSAFKIIGNAIKGAAPFVILFSKAVGATIPVVKALTPVIWGLVAAYASFQIIQKVSEWHGKLGDALSGMTTISAMLMKQMHGQTIAQLASTKATQADLVATLLSAKAITAKNIILGLLTGQLGLSTAATLLKAKAVVILNGVMTTLSGGVGTVIAVIGALVAGTVAMVKWLNRATKEGEKLTKETDELAKSTSSLSDEIESNTKSHEKQLKNIEATSEANKDLAKRIDELSRVENKSAAEKELLASYVEELNGRMGELNLAYDEEADAMSLSSEQIANRINLMKESESGIAGQERMTEIMEEQSQIEQRLEETNKLRAEWNEKLEEGAVTSREHSKAVDELNESQGALETRQVTLRDEYAITEAQVIESMASVVAATEDSVGRQTILYSELSESQKATVDSMKETWQSYQESATDMFDVLSEETELTVSEMASNMEENQRIMGEWADNIATLAERGIEDGLLEQLRRMGPEGAAEVAKLANSSDAEFKRVNKAYGNHGEVVMDTFTTSLGEGAEEAINVAGHLITGVETSLSDSIEAADFASLGGNIADGLAGGVTDNADKAIDAANNIAEDMTKKTKDTLQIQSPSKVFEDIGSDTTSGITLGIKEGTEDVIETAKRLASSIPVPFENLPSEMRNIGVQAMAGLNVGLNAGSARVMATARNIANRVASTMQQALRIQSPSKVMADEVGRWIPEGVAIGIEGNADSVFSAVEKMKGKLMKFSTPEVALGFGMGRPVTVGLSASNNMNSYNDNNIISLLSEIRNLNLSIAKKDNNAYIDGDLITDVVSKRQYQKIQNKGGIHGL